MRGRIRQATPALLGLAALLVTASSGAAQGPRRPLGPASSWGSIFIVAYPGVGRFSSPVGPDNSTATQSWNFGSGLGLGLAAAHTIGTDATAKPTSGRERKVVIIFSVNRSASTFTVREIPYLLSPKRRA